MGRLSSKPVGAGRERQFTTQSTEMRTFADRWRLCGYITDIGDIPTAKPSVFHLRLLLEK